MMIVEQTAAPPNAAIAGRWSVAVALATLIYLLWQIHVSWPVAEDAGTLMRYAWHLGHGLGYTWNPTDPPVDGATDWLSTTILGGLYALGMPLELGPRALGGAAHILSVTLVFWIARRGFRAPLAAALFSAVLVLCGAAKGYIEAGFLTTVFALGVLAGWWCVVAAAERSAPRRAPLFAAAMAATAMTRPEGVGVAVIMLVAAAVVLDSREWRRFAWWTAAVMLPALAVYLAWRVHYFGRWLPLPFLKKGGGALHWDGLRASVAGGVALLGWSAPALVFGLRGGRSLRWAIALGLFVCGYLGMWVFLSPEMNVLWRFQYAVMPVVAASWWAPVSATWQELSNRITLSRASRVALVGCAVVYVGVLVNRQHQAMQTNSPRDGTYDTGVLMRALGGPDNRLATTESGLLPLYSEWRSLDTWGLNDPRVVADGGLTEAYLGSFDPDVIMFHAGFTPLRPTRHYDDVAWDRTWGRMVRTLQRYAVCHGYVLAAVFVPNFFEAHYYYVRPTWPNAARFMAALRAQPYFFWGDPTPSLQLSSLEPAGDCAALSSES